MGHSVRLVAADCNVYAKWTANQHTIFASVPTDELAKAVAIDAAMVENLQTQSRRIAQTT
jgi:hypothetical protein